jgi:aldehyde:ferredoxin oxidoreductase
MYAEMLDEYYAARGWDADGVVRPETAKAAGLGELVKL